MGHSRLRGKCSCQPKRPLRTQTKTHSCSRPGTKPDQIADTGSRLAPLFQITHADASPYPFIQSRQGPVVFGKTVVVDPPPDVETKLPEATIHRDSPRAFRQPTNVVLEVFQCCVTPADLLTSEGKAEEMQLIGSHHFAFGFVDHQLESGAQIFLDPAHDRIAA